MLSLGALLENASAHGADQLRLAAGVEPIIQTASGALPLGTPVPETDLYDALAQVLGSDEQVDLAMGGTVQFQIAAGGRTWSLVARPSNAGVEVMAVAPRGGGGGGGVPAPMAATSSGIAIDLAAIDSLDLDDGEPEIPAASGGSWRNALHHITTAAEVAVDGLDADFAIQVDGGGDETRATRREIPVSTMEEVPLEAPDTFGDAPTPTRSERAPRLPETRADLGAVGLGNGAAVPAAVEVAGPPEVADGDPADPWAEWNPPATPAAPAAVGSVARREAVPLGADPDLGMGTVLGELPDLIAPGTLVLVGREEGLGAELAAIVGLESVIVDESTSEGMLGDIARELAEGAVVVIAAEDPSRYLGYVLRRLEQGMRVVVQTQARTAEGARRVLLGLQVNDHAERWMDQHPCRWVTRAGGRWTII